MARPAGGQTYGPWGNVTSSGSSATSRNYTGQYLDSASGLLYYHARYYDATLARFISADSVVPGQTATSGTANPQQLNRYSYVANNPLTHNDPSGHCSGGFSWGMVNGECYQEAMHQYMDPSRSGTDRAIGFIYAQADIALASVATVATAGAIEAVGATVATETAAAGIPKVMEQRFLDAAAEGKNCYNCVMRAIGGDTITSGQQMPGALANAGYQLTKSPAAGDVALFSSDEFADYGLSVVKHAALYASEEGPKFLSNNVTRSTMTSNAVEKAGYYTLSEIQKMDPALESANTQYFTRR